MTLANPLKGEVSLSTPDGETYILVFDINTLCALEEVWGLDTVQAVVDRFQRCTNNMVDLRKAFWCALQEHHPDLTERDVGRIITAVTFAEAGQKVGEAFAKSFPSQRGAADPRGPRPPKRGGRSGSGTSSSPGDGSLN